jgi:glycopeptide antibiotics resistance protein
MRGDAPRVYSLAAAGWLVFVVCGSLVPFRLRPMTLADAGDYLWTTRDLLASPALWSLSDVLSNAALFAPVGLLGSAALDREWHVRRALLVVALAVMALSLALELGQAFVIRRAPSLVDVAVAVAGTVAGFVLWRRSHVRLDAAAAAARVAWTAATCTQRWLLVYSLLFAAAWLAPFDMTIRPGEILIKQRQQRLLLPFSTSPDAASRPRLATIFICAIPVGAAAALCAPPRDLRRPSVRALTLAGGALVALELSQVAVFSRTTDSTELLVALPAAALGVWWANPAWSRR